MKRYFLCSLIFALGACSLVPGYERPQTTMPTTWDKTLDTSSQDVATSWQSLGSTELTNLIDQALKANNDLQASLQRIAQARASAKISGASLWPQADLGGSASRTHTDPARGSSTHTNTYRLGGSMSYEVDLWNRNGADANAALTRVEASQYDYEALRLMTATDVAQAYFNYLAFSDRLAVARQNLTNTQEVLNIIQARLTAGAVSGIELAQQQASEANARASIASLEQQLDGQRTQLAILTGQPPQGFKIQAKSLADLQLPKISLDQPSSLLERRPDIQRVESQLKEANFNIGAARAAFFPSLNLGLDITAAATSLSSPIALTTTLLASLAQPLFTGGFLEGQLELSKAEKEELINVYRQTILVALKEVEDALTAVRTAQVRTGALNEAVTNARQARRLARQRFDAGAIDFQTLLDTERTQLQAEDSAAQSRADQLSSAIQLYQALGGGWEKTALPEGSAK